LDEVDPDPYVVWTKNKMGRTPAPRPGNFSGKGSGSDDEVTILEVFLSFRFLVYCLPVDLPSASVKPQVLEHAAPLEAEAGSEFLEKLASSGQKNKALAADAGPSQARAAKRARKEIVGGKEVTAKRRVRRHMQVSSG
jgi:hypothetical protein